MTKLEANTIQVYKEVVVQLIKRKKNRYKTCTPNLAVFQIEPSKSKPIDGFIPEASISSDHFIYSILDKAPN